MRGARVRLAVWMVTASFAVVVACGSDGSDPSAPDAGASSGGSSGDASTGCGTRTGGIDLATYADRFCKAFTPCCPQYAYAIDDARCRKTMSSAANDLVYDPVKGEECITAWEAAAKGADFCRTTPPPQVCVDVWKRCATAGPPGVPCKDEYDCALSPEGFVDCEKDQATAPGICRLDAHAKLGDACDGDAVRPGDSPSLLSGVTAMVSRVAVCYLNDGLYCDSGTRKCTARHAVSETCVSDKTCADGLICESADGGSRCEPIHSLGQPCREARDCASALYCDDTTKKCEQRKSVGVPCSKYDQCIARCEDGKCVDLPSANIVYAFYCAARN
jgi:hypothetical protein